MTMFCILRTQKHYNEELPISLGMNLLQIEREQMETPEQHYNVFAKLLSSELQKICRDLKELTRRY